MKTTTIEHDQQMNTRKTGYAIIGFFYAVAAYQVSASIVPFVIDYTGATDWIRLSILIQFIVGFVLSVIAYRTVSNEMLRFGMRVCYGLAVAALFVIGAYTILTSLISL
ncbi:MAG: hypothetical protein ACR2Q3_00725 [Woeseiaceae bacterium]